MKAWLSTKDVESFRGDTKDVESFDLSRKLPAKHAQHKYSPTN